LAVPGRSWRTKPSSSSWCSKRWRPTRPNGSLRHRRPWQQPASRVWWDSLRLSAIRFCQIDLLSRPEDDPLPGFDVPRYRPQAESHVERIDSYGAPECKFTELVLQRVTVAAERYGIAIRRLHSGATVRSRANMRRFRGSCSTTDHARKLSDKGQVLHALPEVRPRLGAGHGTGNAGCRQNVADQGAISRLAYSAAFSASLPGGIRSSFVAQIFSITRSMK
jgi:hypothetical protein